MSGCAAGPAGRRPGRRRSGRGWNRGRRRRRSPGVFEPVAFSRVARPCDLDVVGLVAVLVEPGRIGRHVRESARPCGCRPDRLGGRRRASNGDACGTARSGAQLGHGVVVEAADAHPLGPEALDVDVGDRSAESAAKRSASASCAPFSKIVGLAVPGEVGGGFAGAGGGVDVGGDAARRLARRRAGGARRPCRW